MLSGHSRRFLFQFFTASAVFLFPIFTLTVHGAKPSSSGTSSRKHHLLATTIQQKSCCNQWCFSHESMVLVYYKVLWLSGSQWCHCDQWNISFPVLIAYWARQSLSLSSCCCSWFEAGEEAAVATWMSRAFSSVWWSKLCRGCRIDSKWHGGMQPRRKIWMLAAMKKKVFPWCYSDRA